MDIQPQAAGPRCGAPNRFSGWVSADSGGKFRILPHFLLFSLNGEYKIQE
jgi:hypothetical protein